jgi:hypothetical protein
MQTTTLRDLTAPGLAALGIRGQDVAHVLATMIDRSPLPVTVLIGGLADIKLRITVTRTGERGLSVSEADLLGAPEGTPCRWRTGRLETADGELAAGVFLLWLPCRLDAGILAELDAGTEPAGVILGRLPGGMRREERRAVAADVIDEITGEDASILSRAVLVVAGQAVGLAEENFTAAFIESLA